MMLDPASLISTLSMQLTSSLEDCYLVCAGRTSSRTGHALAPEAQWDSGRYATPHFSIVYLAVLLLSVLIFSHTLEHSTEINIFQAAKSNTTRFHLPHYKLPFLPTQSQPLQKWVPAVTATAAPAPVLGTAAVPPVVYVLPVSSLLPPNPKVRVEFIINTSTRVFGLRRYLVVECPHQMLVHDLRTNCN